MTTNNNNSISGGSGGSGVSKDNTTNDKDNPFAEYMWMGDEDEFNKEALEQIIEDDFIERCFEEMLEQEEMGMFDGTDAPVVDPVELMNNLNLGVQENVVAAASQNVGYLEENGGGDEGGEAGHSNEGGNHGSRNDGDHQEDQERTNDDNSEDSVSDIDSDASSDAPLR